MKTIRVGILGFAHAHVNAYCQRWREQPSLGVAVVAGWDADPQRAAGGGEAHGVTMVASEEAILNDPRIDAVVIANETARHVGAVEKAAAAGKTVILQKPLATTLDDADRMAAAVDKFRIPFTLAWQMRVDPHNLQVRDLLADGRFGKVYQLRRRHCLSTHLWPDFETSWHVQPALNRDIFADDAAHPVDFIYWLLGMPASVIAELGTLRNPRIANDHAVAVFRYPDGAFAEASCSFAAAGGENCLEILCENGVIIGNYGDQVTCMLPRPPGGIQLKWFFHGDTEWSVSNLPEITDQGQRIAALAEPLADFLHQRRPAIAGVHEGRDVLRMLCACYDAADTGRRVDFQPVTSKKMMEFPDIKRSALFPIGLQPLGNGGDRRLHGAQNNNPQTTRLR